MATSDNGVDFIQGYEKLSLKPYDDGYGNMTIGWGHLIQPGESFTTITEERADELFREDLAEAENAVHTYVMVPLHQWEFDALVSLAYNLGSSAFRRSTLLKRLNSNDYDGAAEAFVWYRFEDGVESRGLLRRRKAEQKIFQKGEYK